MALHTIALCAGVGMLDEGLRAGCEFLGIDSKTVCYVEREAFAAATLVKHMEAGSVDAAPIVEMALYRYKLQLHLSHLFNELESRESAA